MEELSKASRTQKQVLPSSASDPIWNDCYQYFALYPQHCGGTLLKSCIYSTLSIYQLCSHQIEKENKSELFYLFYIVKWKNFAKSFGQLGNLKGTTTRSAMHWFFFCFQTKDLCLCALYFQFLSADITRRHSMKYYHGINNLISWITCEQLSGFKPGDMIWHRLLLSS